MFNQAKIFLNLAIGCIIAVLVPVDLARGAETTLSLPEVVAPALSISPELAVERRQTDVAKGELTKARVYPLNQESSELLAVANGLRVARGVNPIAGVPPTHFA